MLKEREASIVHKNQEMLHKQKQSILQLISCNNSLTNQRLDSLSMDINDLEENLEFSQSEYDDKLKNMGDKLKEGEINLIKEALHVIQITKAPCAIETDVKLADLEIRCRCNIELAHRTEKRNKIRFRPIIAQFSYRKDKKNILKNCIKLRKARFSISEDLPKETATIPKEKWQKAFVNRKEREIPYLNDVAVICKQKFVHFFFKLDT